MNGTKKWIFIFLYVAASLPASAAQSHEVKSFAPREYWQRWGLRLESGALPYISIDAGKFNATKLTDIVGGLGLAIPVRLEATWNATNAFELLLGFEYIPSVYNFSGTDKYATQYGTFAGIRYFINTGDPVKLYGAVRGHFMFDRLNAQFDVSSGLQFTLTHELDMFLQIGFAPAIASYADLGNDLQLGVPFALGLHYRF